MNAPLTMDKLTEERTANEQQLLGGLLSASSVAYMAAASVLEPHHFVDPFHSVLFRLLGEATDAGLDGFKRTHWIMSQIRDIPAIQQLEMQASEVIAAYTASAAPQAGLGACARLVRYDFLKASLNTAVAEGDLTEVTRLATEMERIKAAHKATDESIESIGDIADKVIARINEAHMADEPITDFAFSGAGVLGDMLGGWRRKRLYIIAGRPGMGKSSVALSLLLRTARKGHGVMFFALEMGREELTEMALCSLAWRPDQRIEYRDIAASSAKRDGFGEKFQRICETRPKLDAMPFFIGDRGGLTVAEIRAQALNYAQKLAAQGKKLEVIAIDHMGLMKASDRYAGNKVQETEEISGALKSLAKELDCAVIALCQISRGVEGRDDKRPGLPDLRWSGAIEQDADVVLFVYREAYYLERIKHDTMDEEADRTAKLGQLQSRIELLIAKHRGGPCGAVELFCDMGCAIVLDPDVVYR